MYNTTVTLVEAMGVLELYPQAVFRNIDSGDSLYTDFEGRVLYEDDEGVDRQLFLDHEFKRQKVEISFMEAVSNPEAFCVKHYLLDKEINWDWDQAIELDVFFSLLAESFDAVQISNILQQAEFSI